MDVRPLLLLAKTISAEHGVSVRFAEINTARCIYSDGKYRIELPFSDAENANLLYRGYIDHEVGHVRFTQFGNGKASPGTLGALENVFEDEYVERRMGALFPGSKINLRDLGRTIFTEEHVKGALQTSAISRFFAFALYHRRSLLDPELGKWNDMIDDSLRELGVPEDVMRDMMRVVETSSNSTAENNQLAQELYDLFKPYADQELPQQQNGQGDGSGDDEDDSEQQGQSGGDQEDEQGDEQQENGDGAGNVLPEVTPDDFSVSSRISKELTSKPSSSLFDLEQQLAEASALANGVAAGMTDDELKRRGVMVEACLSESMVSALRKRIPALLQNSRIRPCAISSRGRLYGKRLARVATLDVNVFHAPARKTEQDIEVGFLSDYSGSMNGLSSELDKAVYASLVMLKTLPKVKSFAYGFHGYIYRCLCPKNSQRVNDFHGLHPASSTPLGAAMLNIATEFGKTGRRILIVTTDGRPDGRMNSCREVCALIAKMGIEMYGIGIGCGAGYLHELFGVDKSAMIDSIADYPARLEVMLRKAMLCAN